MLAPDPDAMPARSTTPPARRSATSGPTDAPRRSDVQEDPDREPGRDRLPGHQDRPADGHRAPSRSIPTPTPRRCTCGWPTRRCTSARRRRASPTSSSTGSSRRSARPAPRRCIRATASSPSARTSPRRWRRRASPSSARRSARSRRWATRSPRRSSPPRPGVSTVPGYMGLIDDAGARGEDRAARSAIR